MQAGAEDEGPDERELEVQLRQDQEDEVCGHHQQVQVRGREQPLEGAKTEDTGFEVDLYHPGRELANEVNLIGAAGKENHNGQLAVTEDARHGCAVPQPDGDDKEVDRVVNDSVRQLAGVECDPEGGATNI